MKAAYLVLLIVLVSACAASGVASLVATGIVADPPSAATGVTPELDDEAESLDPDPGLPGEVATPEGGAR